MTEQRQGTRERLLSAALTVVGDAGVAGATSRQIAAAAGTNLQAITYHFGSKDELVAQALVGAVRAWLEPARAALRGLTEDPAGHLVRAVWELQAALADARPRVPAYLEALALVPRSEPFREQIRELMRQLRAELAARLEELQEAGYLAPWVEPEPMAALVLAAADGTAIHLALDPDGIDPDDVLAQVVPLLLAASTLTPDPGDPDGRLRGELGRHPGRTGVE
ncbi:MAG TPA: TetR/AcrR family transcriptional regulator [Kineosporiaceae bacterium]